MSLSSIAVFCGSKRGNNPIYLHHAAELGKILALHDITLIYGGARVGIMGIIADTVMGNGGKVVGVIPKVLVDRERQHEGITELIVADDMHARKRKLYELCDAAVVLAGGFGTLDELFEMLTWNQLSIHNKRIFLVNSDGFYDHLFAHLQNIARDGFLYDELEQRITILQQPSALVQYLL